MHTFKTRLAMCVSAGLLLSTPLPAIAAPLDVPDTPYNYTVLDQDLAVTLKEFGSNMNLKVSVSSEISGRIRGRMPTLPPREFLDHLTQIYNLQWYYDGLILYVTAAHEAQSRLLVLTPITFEEFSSALDAFKISDERFVVQRAAQNSLVLVSGPPRFIALAEQTLNGLVAEARSRPRPSAPQKQSSESVLMLFRGSQATTIRGGIQTAPAESSKGLTDGIVRAPALDQ